MPLPDTVRERAISPGPPDKVNVSLAPRAVTERMARKKKPNDGNPNMPSQKEERHARDPARYPLKENDQLAQQWAANRSWV